jgi:threonine aldolase
VDVIDLRSDTVTHPTPKMREAMANAVVGDDVFGDDPTVNQLEADAAKMLGKEAAVFVSSGTQGNLIALLTHCGRGDEAILGDKTHSYLMEAGGMSALGGVHPRTVPVQSNGEMNLDDIRNAIRMDDEHFPRTKLICAENTQSALGGVPVSKAFTDQVAEIAHDNNLKFHIDGARLFNAATALNTPVNQLVENADSVMFCLSKGLCAPVGSMLVGSADFIHEARRARKLLGGSMRQVGVVAAAGLIALHEMTTRLSEDHANAGLMGEELENVSGVQITSINTNFVYFNLLEDAKVSPQTLVEELRKRNILLTIYPGFKRKFRIVTHYWITQDRVREVASAMREILN